MLASGWGSSTPMTSSIPQQGSHRCCSRTALMPVSHVQRRGIVLPFSSRQTRALRPAGPQSARCASDSKTEQQVEAADSLRQGPAQHLASTLVAAAFAIGLCSSIQLTVAPPAGAVLNSPNAQIARTAEVALRRAIPANNALVRGVQGKLEGIQFKLRIPQRKPWGAISEDAATAAATMANTEQVLEGVPAGREEQGRQLIADVQEGMRRLQGVVEMQNPDKVSFRLADVLKDLSDLEVLQAPGLPYIIPRDYAEYPHLTGRAVVEMTIEKSDGALGYVTNEGGGPQAQAHLTLVLDGYSAPVTAGNFVQNVLQGVYTGAALKVDGGAVLAGSGALSEKSLPLEILPLGQFDIVYKSPLDVRGGELPVLPLSIYGALAMSHGPDDGLAAADEFFIYKFDRQSSGLAGLSFDEGEFGVFGYVTKGSELIPQLQGGDVITSARLVSGTDRLTNGPSAIAEQAVRSAVMYGS